MRNKKMKLESFENRINKALSYIIKAKSNSINIIKDMDEKVLYNSEKIQTLKEENDTLTKLVLLNKSIITNINDVLNIWDNNED